MIADDFFEPMITRKRRTYREEHRVVTEGHRVKKSDLCGTL